LYPALQEYVNGQLKNKYGDAFIRGNNGEPQARINAILSAHISALLNDRCAMLCNSAEAIPVNECRECLQCWTYSTMAVSLPHLCMLFQLASCALLVLWPGFAVRQPACSVSAICAAWLLLLLLLAVLYISTVRQQ
jgi:hypothetical protein